MSKPNTRLINLMDTIIVGGICLLAFALPLFVSPFTFEKHEFNKQFLLIVFVLVLLLLWISSGILLKKKLIITRTPLDYPILAFLGIYLLSSIFSVNRINSFFGALGQGSLGFITVLAYVLVYFLVVNNIRSLPKIRLVIASLLGSVFFVIVGSLLQINKVFLLPFSASKENSFNTIGSLSSLIAYIGPLFPLLIAVLFSKFRNRSINLSVKIIVFVTVALTLVLFNLVNFKLGWYTLIIGNFVLLVTLIARINESGRKSKNSRLRFIAVPAIVFALAIFSITLNFKPVIQTNLPAEVSLGRSISWQIAQSAIKENLGRFFFGSGPETFLYDFSQKRPDTFNQNPLWQIRFEKANNYYAEILATTGVLGSISFLIILLVGLGVTVFLLTNQTKQIGLKSILKPKKKVADASNQAETKDEAEKKPQNSAVRLNISTGKVEPMADTISEALGEGNTLKQTWAQKFDATHLNDSLLIGLSATWITLVITHFMFSGRISSFFVLWLVMALIVSTDYCLRPDSYTKLKLSFRTSPKYALALSFAFVLSFTLVVVMFTYIGRIYMADIKYQKGISVGTDFAKGEMELVGAISLNKYRPEYHLALALNYLGQANQEAQKTEDRNDQRIAQLLAASLANVKQGTDLAGNNVNLWESRGQIYQNVALYSQDANEWIIKSYAEVAKLDPKNPIAYTELGKAYLTKAVLAQEDKDGENLKLATENFQKALELKPDYIEASYNLAEAYVAREMLNEGIAEMARSVNLAPNNTNILYELGRFVYNRSLLENTEDEAKQIDQETAKVIFERVVELNENHANALFSLGLIYEQRDEISNAISQYEKILENNPENDDLRTRVETLKSSGSTPEIQEEAPAPKEE